MRIPAAVARSMGLVSKKPATPAQRQLAKVEREKYEDALAVQLDRLGIKYDRQLQLLPDRKFKADFLFPKQTSGYESLVVEVDGGTWLPNSSHGRGGYEADRERDALALLVGWRVLRVTPRMVKDGRAAAWIERLVGIWL